MSPDWRNPRDYAYTKRLNYCQWAWEFLRRNPKYREWWESLALEIGDDPAKPHVAGNVSRWVAENADWGLASLCDPVLDARRCPVVWNPTPNVAVLQPGTDANAYREKRCPEGQLVLIDLDYPIEPQLEIAGKFLLGAQRLLKKPVLKEADYRDRKEKWIDYLRALDGRDGAVTYLEIGEVLWPNLYASDADVRDMLKSKARDTLDQAKALRDGGYRKIITFSRRQPHNRRKRRRA